ncbi:MAG: hypothetical protein NTV46_15945 [Verrucomicrobia bacterium]|nr:hypothetical protein [Verrucomicrobiota bacterium]
MQRFTFAPLCGAMPVRGVPQFFQVRYRSHRVQLADLPMLEVSESAATLTRILLAKDLIPTKAAPDAIHIAVASAHGMD